MRYTIPIVLLFLLAVVSSCEKKDRGGNVLSQQSLQGAWELRASGGGFSGQTTNYPAGNGTRYVFSTGSYQYYQQGTLALSGSYYLSKDTFYLDKQVLDVIVFDNDTLSRIMISMKGGKLQMALDAPDAGWTEWQRYFF